MTCVSAFHSQTLGTLLCLVVFSNRLMYSSNIALYQVISEKVNKLSTAVKQKDGKYITHFEGCIMSHVPRRFEIYNILSLQ